MWCQLPYMMNILMPGIKTPNNIKSMLYKTMYSNLRTKYEGDKTV